MKIRLYNNIAPKGIERFDAGRYQCESGIEEPDAYLLRSHKLHGEAVPPTLKAVARAGAGVNNIPVADYTARGIVVFNTPGANANAVKELVMAGLLLSSRGIYDGISYAASLSDIGDAAVMSKRLEAEKKRFAGQELKGKRLGVIGLGAIGSMVAEMALAMGMEVAGFDPQLSVEAAWRLSNQVQRMDNMAALLSCSDYVSLHVPALDATRHMIDREALDVIKPGAILLNFARASIVQSEAIVDALKQGQLSKYVCDFPEPSLIGNERVIAMPHIGASTREAEENCAVMAADQLIAYLDQGNIRNSVNFPAVFMAPTSGHRITFSNQNVAGVLGDVLSVLAQHQANVLDMVNKSRGNIAYNIIDVETEPPAAVQGAIAAVDHVIDIRVLKG